MKLTFTKTTFLLYLLTVFMAILLRGFNLANIDIPHPKIGWAMTSVFTFLGLFFFLMSYYVVVLHDFPVLPTYVYYYLHAASIVQYYSNFQGLLRGFWFRALITIPVSWYHTNLLFQTISFFTLHKLAPKFFTISRISSVIFLITAFGCYNSGVTYTSVVDIHLGNQYKNNLKIIQIADPHLGNFMSIERLRSISENTVKMNPDLVLLTGDYYTVESHNEKDAILRAFEPLKQLKGKVFACLGNHDHEVNNIPEQFERLGIRLLVDEEEIVKTRLGPIQIVGIDYVWENSVVSHFKHHSPLFDKKEKIPYRIVLLHNPRHFKFVPKTPDVHSIVFSGHLHGGQIGFGEYSFLKLTNLIFPTFPDQGVWCLNENSQIVQKNCTNESNLLYVHKGVGFYGLQLKIGIENEESLINLNL
jgi:uncharacterized protein